MKPVQWQDEIERLSRDIDLTTFRQALAQADIRAIGSGATNDPFKPQCHLQGRA